MRGPIGDQLVAAGADVEQPRDLVAHRAARQKHRRLLAEELCNPLFERARGRVLAALLVSDLGRGDRGAHPGRGPFLRVAVEVDRGHLRQSTQPRYDNVGTWISTRSR